MKFNTLMVSFDSGEEFDEVVSGLQKEGVTVWECNREEGWAEFDVSGFTPKDFYIYFRDPCTKSEYSF